MPNKPYPSCVRTTRIVQIHHLAGEAEFKKVPCHLSGSFLCVHFQVVLTQSGPWAHPLQNLSIWDGGFPLCSAQEVVQEEGDHRRRWTGSGEKHPLTWSVLPWYHLRKMLSGHGHLRRMTLPLSPTPFSSPLTTRRRVHWVHMERDLRGNCPTKRSCSKFIRDQLNSHESDF